MKKFATAAMTIATLSTGSLVQAQEFYGSVFGGVTRTGSFDTVNEANFGPFDMVETEYPFANSTITGLTIGASIGYNMRAEAEFSYADYPIRDVNATAKSSSTGAQLQLPGVIPDDSSAQITYVLANLWYDIPVTSGGSDLQPYFGGGIGRAKVEDGTKDRFVDTSGLAYQLGLGVQMPLGTRGAVDVGYRYKAVKRLTIESIDDPTSDPADGEIFSNIFQIGYQIRF